MSKLLEKLPPHLREQLKRLAQQEGIPEEQVLRKAIAFQKLVQDERAKGNRIVITDDNDNVIREILPS